MPLYEYQCRSCGRTFEMLRRMKDADSDLECPECRSRKKLSASFPRSHPGDAARPLRAALPERDRPRPVGRSFRWRVRVYSQLSTVRHPHGRQAGGNTEQIRRHSRLIGESQRSKQSTMSSRFQIRAEKREIPGSSQAKSSTNGRTLGWA